MCLSYIRVPGLLASLLDRARAVLAFMSCSQRQRSVGYFGTLAIWLILILIAEFVGNVVRGQGIEWWLFDFVVWSVSAAVVRTAVATTVEIVVLLRSEHSTSSSDTESFAVRCGCNQARLR